jgi:plastocyanin
MTNGRFAVLALAAAVTPLQGGAAAAKPRQYVVVIDQMKFGPVAAGVRVGDAIIWVNRDLFRHSVTARDGSFDLDLAPGKSGETIIRKAGMIAFACKYHPRMTGIIKVAQ